MDDIRIPLSLHGRRAMVGGGAVLAFLGLSVVAIAINEAASPDQRILNLCKAYEAVHRELKAMLATPLEGWTFADDDRRDAIMDRMEDFLAQAVVIPAVTIEGHRAKARMAVAELELMNTQDELLNADDAATTLAWRVLLDIAVEGRI